MITIFWNNTDPDIKYIKGTGNDEVYALIRIMLIKSDITDIDITKENLYEIYCLDIFDGNTFQLSYRMIYKYQNKDKELVEIN